MFNNPEVESLIINLELYKTQCINKDLNELRSRKLNIVSLLFF